MCGGGLYAVILEKCRQRRENNPLQKRSGRLGASASPFPRRCIGIVSDPENVTHIHAHTQTHTHLPQLQLPRKPPPVRQGRGGFYGGGCRILSGAPPNGTQPRWININRAAEKRKTDSGEGLWQQLGGGPSPTFRQISPDLDPVDS